MLKKSSSAGGRCRRGIVRAGGPNAGAAGEAWVGAAGVCGWTVFCEVLVCEALLCDATRGQAVIAASTSAATVRTFRRASSRRPRPRSNRKPPSTCIRTQQQGIEQDTPRAHRPDRKTMFVRFTEQGTPWASQEGHGFRVLHSWFQLEQRTLPPARRDLEILVRQLRGDAAAGGAVEEPSLH